jgi:hypothetical protein
MSCAMSEDRATGVVQRYLDELARIRSPSRSSEH